MGKSRWKRRKARAHRKREREQEEEHEQDRKRRKTRVHQEQDKEQEDEHEEDQGQGRVQDQGEEQKQSSECIDAFSSFIKSEMEDLEYFLQTRYGLLEVLVCNNVLTSKQVSIIQEKDSDRSQVRQLLEEITRQTISDEKKEAFMRALDQTKQKHVSNFIRGNRKRSAEYGDDWPLLCCTEFTKLEANRSKIIDLIDTRNGLLDYMLSADCISTRRIHLIEEGSTDEVQSERLLHTVLKGSLATYNALIRGLIKTKQHHVVYVFEPSLAEDIRPLSDEQQSRLQKNYATLIRIIDMEDGTLTAELYAANCITKCQKEYIEQTAITHSERKKRLINIVRRGSEANFYKFIECLNNTGQHHVSRILIEDGAVAHIVANISPANNREERERQIVDKLNAKSSCSDILAKSSSGVSLNKALSLSTICLSRSSLLFAGLILATMCANAPSSISMRLTWC